MRGVMRRRGLMGLAVVAILVSACGGSSSTPPLTTATPPPPATGANVITISPFDESEKDSTATGGASTTPIFPAPDPAGMLALAALHPDGRIVYATVLDGTQGELTIARLGNSAMVATTRDSKTVRVGMDLTDSSITWVCVTEGADTPKCRNRDFKSEGSNALARAALLVGEDHVRQIASRITGTPDATLKVRLRANNIDASCLSGTQGGSGGLLICVSPSGFITDTKDGATIARASKVKTTFDPAELQPLVAIG